MEDEKLYMNFNPLSYIQLNKLLDYLIKNDKMVGQIDNLKIRYYANTDDEKTELFLIERTKKVVE